MPSKGIDEVLQLHAAGQIDKAEIALRQILSVEPSNSDALHLLGLLIFDRGETDGGLELIRKAIGVAPLSQAYRKSLEVLLKAAPAIDACNAGAKLAKEGRYAEAIAEFERSVLLNPSFANAHYNLGLELLRQGEFVRGFREYEFRFQISRSSGLKVNTERFSQPRWDGGEISGKRILIHAEQGHGDVIQMVRYARLLKSAGAKVVASVHQELVRLARSSADIEQVASGGEGLAFDLHCPLVSLPLALQATLETIPADIPYLYADPAGAKIWGDRIVAAAEGHRRVGICWAGNPKHLNDKNRSIAPDLLVPILRLPGLRFFSLQKGNAVPAGVIDWTGELGDFADTAAMIANLDLVVTVDTAVAHLAGALGRSTFLLLPFLPDLALDAESVRFSVVSDDASISAKVSRGLAWSD